MKRKTHRATVMDAAGDVIAERDAYAWNSTIRASEALVRELACERGSLYLGQSPTVAGEDDGRVYSRVWHGEDGRMVRVYVREPVAS